LGVAAHRSFFAWTVLKALLAFLAASFRSRSALLLEILALRDQIAVLQRSVKRPKLTGGSTPVGSALCRVGLSLRYNGHRNDSPYNSSTIGDLFLMECHLAERCK
jgi:hypothetical protein